MSAEPPMQLPYNPGMLRWAREWRGRDVQKSSARAGTTVERLNSWESGEAVPTVRQARILADYYERPFLEFFLDQPPPVANSALVPDFRLHRAAADPRADREIKAIQEWAEEQRLNALDLFELIGEQPPVFPEELRADAGANPDVVASLARRFAGFGIDEQFSLTSQNRGNMPKMVRKAIEQLGALVLKESGLAKFGVRGLCIFDTPLPVVVFGTEAPAAQAFTMAHELGHVIIQQSAISGPPTVRVATNTTEAIERWCDQFAAAFLVPADAIAKIWAKPNAAMPAIGDEMLARLANTFAVSRHAMLIRLVDLGYIESAYYWDHKRADFLKEESDFKGGGIAKYYGTRYRSAQGDLYTGLVLEAWDIGAITSHNAAEFMGIKNIRHLDDIREKFRP